MRFILTLFLLITTTVSAQTLQSIDIDSTHPNYWTFVADHSDELSRGIVMLSDGDKKYLSGFFVADNLIATAKHGVTKIGEKLFVTRDKHSEVAIGTVVAIGEGKDDIALLEVHDLSFVPYVFQMASTKQGQVVYTYGYGNHPIARGILGYAPIGSRGLVNEIRKTTDINIIQHSSTVRPGHSGSPLLNEKLQVIGVNVAIVPTTKMDIDAVDGYIYFGYDNFEAEPILKIKELMKGLKQ